MKVLKPFIVELAPTLSEHWYYVWRAQSDGLKGEYLGIFPSSTTILTKYPQSEELVKWIAREGFHESRQIRDSAGKAGTKIHLACDALEKGEILLKENYSLEEWYKISTFINWHKDYTPEIIAKEFPIFSESGLYAGRPDRLYKIENAITLLDEKSSRSLSPHFPLQVASYAKAVEENTDLEIAQTAILQLGAKNNKGYRFETYSNWRDHYRVFEHVYGVWKYAETDSNGKIKEPLVLELPDSLKL